MTRPTSSLRSATSPLALSLALALAACSGPDASDQPDHAVITDPGAGPDNAEPLWVPRVGQRWVDARSNTLVISALAVRKGRPVYVLHAATRTIGEQHIPSEPWTETWLHVGGDGAIYLAGSPRAGDIEPLLLVPAKVRHDMAWRSGSAAGPRLTGRVMGGDGGWAVALTYEHLGVTRTATLHFDEGYGPRAPFSRDRLIDWLAVDPELSVRSSDPPAREDEGSQRPLVPLTLASPEPALAASDLTLLTRLNAVATADGVFLDVAARVFYLNSNIGAVGFFEDAGGACGLFEGAPPFGDGDAALNPPGAPLSPSRCLVPGLVHQAPAGAPGPDRIAIPTRTYVCSVTNPNDVTTERPCFSPTWRILAMAMDAQGEPVAVARPHEHPTSHTVGPIDPHATRSGLSQTVLPHPLMEPGAISTYLPQAEPTPADAWDRGFGRPATSATRATPSTLSRAPDGTLTALIARDGALYAARLDLGESGRGLIDVHRVATETDALSRWQHRDNRTHTFITTGAGSIDELVVHPDGTSAQIPRAQLDLPDGHFLIGVFPDHQDPEVFYAVLQRGFRGVDPMHPETNPLLSEFDRSVGPALGEPVLYTGRWPAPAAAPPRGFHSLERVSMLPSGADVVVCGAALPDAAAREAAWRAAAATFTLGGVAAAAVAPHRDGHCALVVRDLRGGFDPAADDAWHLTGAVPGHGRVRIAATPALFDQPLASDLLRQDKVELDALLTRDRPAADHFLPVDWRDAGPGDGLAPGAQVSPYGHVVSEWGVYEGQRPDLAFDPAAPLPQADVDLVARDGRRWRVDVQPADADAADPSGGLVITVETVDGTTRIEEPLPWPRALLPSGPFAFDPLVFHWRFDGDDLVLDAGGDEVFRRQVTLPLEAAYLPPDRVHLSGVQRAFGVYDARPVRRIDTHGHGGQLHESPPAGYFLPPDSPAGPNQHRQWYANGPLRVQDAHRGMLDGRRIPKTLLAPDAARSPADATWRPATFADLDGFDPQGDAALDWLGDGQYWLHEYALFDPSGQRLELPGIGFGVPGEAAGVVPIPPYTSGYTVALSNSPNLPWLDRVALPPLAPGETLRITDWLEPLRYEPGFDPRIWSLQPGAAVDPRDGRVLLYTDEGAWLYYRDGDGVLQRGRLGVGAAWHDHVTRLGFADDPRLLFVGDHLVWLMAPDTHRVAHTAHVPRRRTAPISEPRAALGTRYYDVESVLYTFELQRWDASGPLPKRELVPDPALGHGPGAWLSPDEGAVVFIGDYVSPYPGAVSEAVILRLDLASGALDTVGPMPPRGELVVDWLPFDWAGHGGVIDDTHAKAPPISHDGRAVVVPGKYGVFLVRDGVTTFHDLGAQVWSFVAAVPGAIAPSATVDRAVATLQLDGARAHLLLDLAPAEPGGDFVLAELPDMPMLTARLDDRGVLASGDFDVDLRDGSLIPKLTPLADASPPSYGVAYFWPWADGTRAFTHCGVAATVGAADAWGPGLGGEVCDHWAEPILSDASLWSAVCMPMLITDRAGRSDQGTHRRAACWP